MIGTITKIDFTYGGAGNQWTWIDGVKYATYWSIGNGIAVGKRVEYRPYMASLWSGNPKIKHASIIGVIREEPTTAAI